MLRYFEISRDIRDNMGNQMGWTYIIEIVDQYRLDIR